MKKLALLLALMMVLGAIPGWCLSATVDTFVEGRKNSSLHAVGDAGQILDVANRGIDGTYTAITTPLKPILDPVRRVRDESFKAVNHVYDFVTFRRHRTRE